MSECALLRSKNRMIYGWLRKALDRTKSIWRRRSWRIFRNRGRQKAKKPSTNGDQESERGVSTLEDLNGGEALNPSTYLKDKQTNFCTTHASSPACSLVLHIRDHWRTSTIVISSSLLPLSSYTLTFNHSTSLASALPRCEILFFSALSISAYVCLPSYSNAESQPGMR